MVRVQMWLKIHGSMRRHSHMCKRVLPETSFRAARPSYCQLDAKCKPEDALSRPSGNPGSGRGGNAVVGAWRFELQTSCAQGNCKKSISLVRLALFCVVVPSFGPNLAVVGPKLDPILSTTPL